MLWTHIIILVVKILNGITVTIISKHYVVLLWVMYYTCLQPSFFTRIKQNNSTLTLVYKIQTIVIIL